MFVRRAQGSVAAALAIALSLLRCSALVDTNGLSGGVAQDTTPDGNVEGTTSNAAGGDLPDSTIVGSLADAEATDGETGLDARRDGGKNADARTDAFPQFDATPTPSAYVTAVLADGPKMYLRFEEASGSTVHDEMGLANGVAIGNVGRGVPGAFTGSLAIEMDGAAGTVSAGDVFDLEGRTPYSIEGWFRPSLYINGAQFAFGKEDTDEAGIEEYGLYFHKSIGMVFERYVGGQAQVLQTALPPMDGLYHHIVVTYDGTICTLYLDGAPISTRSDTRSAATKRTLFFIGTLTGAGGFCAAVDEFAVYDRALAGDRILAHFNAASL